jgi:hypothetical protein
MTTYAHERPGTHAGEPGTHERPDPPELATAHEAPRDRLGLFRGVAIALPVGLLFWAALLAAAWCLWRG